mgnify:CR=1 FL=1
MSTPAPYPAPWHGPSSTPPAPGRPLTSGFAAIAVAVQLGLAAVIVISGWVAVLSVRGLLIVQRIQYGDYDAADEASGLMREIIVMPVLYAIAYIAAGALFITWLSWLRRSDRVAAEAMRYGPGWAIGGWLIPIVNFFRPYQVLTDLWRGLARPWVPHQAPHQPPTPTLLRVWWGAFLGASQGGILGGASSSVTDDWSRVVLAVGGLGYNLLLPRSVDFDEFRSAFEGAYPGELDRLLVLELAEQLWDRGENAGYAQHLTRDPYDGVEKKQVLALEAFGDHQVTNLATRRLVRTLGLERRSPTLADGRTPLQEPFFGIDELRLPSNGSGYYVWDFGTPAPPNDDTPNRGGDDPHGDLGGTPAALALLVSFVQEGKTIDVCPAGQPCTG